jgi:anaerobic magnesium-protoporphyrin IX monomethyl ester cyclase
MIILFHPRATRPRNRRLPLSVLALGAVLEGREEYEIVDGNVEERPVETMLQLIDSPSCQALKWLPEWKRRGRCAIFGLT